MYWNFSVGLKWVLMSKSPCFSKRSPLNMVVSKKVATLSETWAVAFIVGRFALCTKSWTSLFVAFTRRIRCDPLYSSGFIFLFSNIQLFTFAMKVLANATVAMTQD